MIRWLYFFIKFQNFNAARILAVFPIPAISHQVVFRPLTQELAKRGHEVVVITPYPAFHKGKTMENLKEINVHNISYEMWRGACSEMVKGYKRDWYVQVNVLTNVVAVLVEAQVQTDEVQRMIKNKSMSFDLLLTESGVRSVLSFSHLYNVPTIQVSSLSANVDSYHIIGAPTHPIIYPSITHQRLFNLTFLEKIKEIFNHYYLEYILTSHEIVENEMLKRNFNSEIHSVSELRNNVQRLLLNTYPIWEGNYPVPPGVIYMGGLREVPTKDLPKDLKKYLDASNHGAIYISFGTNVNLLALGPEKIQIFVKVFSQLPYEVLWKWDADELPGQFDNVYFSKWFPQYDLLGEGHENIKLFITQGGMQSTEEAIASGVPLIGIPLLMDQWYNSEKYIYHKIGIRLDFETLTEKKLRNAINTIIGNESYRHNVLKLNTLMRDLPQRPLERAVWWTEHVLRHGGARHLRSPAANMSWAEYFELELILVLLSTLFVISVVLIFVVYSLFRLLLE